MFLSSELKHPYKKLTKRTWINNPFTEEAETGRFWELTGLHSLINECLSAGVCDKPFLKRKKVQSNWESHTIIYLQPALAHAYFHTYAHTLTYIHSKHSYIQYPYTQNTVVLIWKINAIFLRILVRGFASTWNKFVTLMHICSKLARCIFILTIVKIKIDLSAMSFESI